jgi:hypothetical protein
MTYLESFLVRRLLVGRTTANINRVLECPVPSGLGTQ